MSVCSNNKFGTKKVLGAAIAAVVSTGIMAPGSALAEMDPITEALTSGTAFGDLRLRYEDVEAGSTDSDQLTLRSRIGYKTKAYEGFSALVEFEDVREIAGIDDENSLVLDQEMTELDQGFIQYKNDMVTAKLGRQVIALDGQRHIGHVGWRQDRQTFDAARVTVKPMDGLTVDLAHIYRVNRINSPVWDSHQRDASYNLLNVSYASPIGKVGAYYYDLSEEIGGPGFDAIETTGISLTGKQGDDVKFLYSLEYATQDNETKDADMDYMLAELGVSASGVTGKVGYEVLGSDDGAEAFATPLATVHKFAGWADVFAAPSLFGTVGGGAGLVDTYASVGGKVAGVKLLAVYHDFETDEGGDDLGSEIDLLVAKKFNKTYSGGLKYADYSAPSGGTDKTILWGWVGMKF